MRMRPAEDVAHISHSETKSQIARVIYADFAKLSLPESPAARRGLAVAGDLSQSVIVGDEDRLSVGWIRFGGERKLAAIVKGGRLEVVGENPTAWRRIAQIGNDMELVGRTTSQCAAWGQAQAHRS